MAQLKTVLEIIQDAVSAGLGQPRSPIQNDVLLEAIGAYNRIGQQLYDLFPFDAKKIDPFLTSNSTYVGSYVTTTGIITFTSTVDIVRAVRPVDPGTGDPTYALWPQDDIDAAFRHGADVGTARFIYMTDGTDGLKRIKVNPDDAVATYSILATSRFVRAIVSGSYSSNNPSATPTDYRVLTWPLHHALPAIITAVTDELRVWDGQQRQNDTGRMFQTAVDKVTRQEARETVVVPADPAFGDSGCYEVLGNVFD